MRALRATLALASLALAILGAGTGLAGATRVVLIGPSTTHATVVRVQQELVLLGLQVEIVAPDATADLASLAREHDAAAVARVEDSPAEIILWVDAAHSANAAQGAPTMTRVSESLSGSADPGLLALRAVELLRGRLIPVAATTATAAATSAPTTSAAASARPMATTAPAVTAAPSGSAEGPRPSLHPTRARIHVGPAIVATPGGVPPTPGLRVGGGYRVAERLEIEGLALVPLAPATVSANEGDMDLRALAFGAGASVAFTRPESPWALHAGAGIGVAGLFFEGRARSPWVSASGSHWSAMPFLGASAAYRFTPVLAARADLMAGFVLPEAVLVIAEREVAAFGVPAFVGSLALEVHP